MGANWGCYNSPNGWPYTNFHELNLDWILEKLKKNETDITTAQQAIDETNNNVTALSTQNTNTLKTAIKGKSIYNLLDNSYFANPVNQRGKTTYNGSGYTIDRWRTWDTGDVTIHDGYISVETSIYQNISTKLDTSKAYTLIVMNTDNQFTLVSGSITNDLWGSGINLMYNNGESYVRIYAEPHTKNLVWAALYEGAYNVDSFPEYVLKGYAVELAECQRYYRPFITDALAMSTNSTTIDASMQLNPPMRIPPTITITSVINAYTPDGIKNLTIGAPSICTESYASYTFNTETVGAGVPCVVTGIVGYLSADY